MHREADPHRHTILDAHSSSCAHGNRPFLNELANHLPFSILSVALGLMLAGLICFFASDQALADAHRALLGDHADHDHGHAQEGDDPHAVSSQAGFLVLFHLFHPAHMLFSAAATTLMFMRYDRHLLKAAVVGFSGAVIVCGISDIVMPHCSALLMQHSLPWHICIVEHPMLVVPFAIVGVGIGVSAAFGGILRSTIFSHSMHVFASTMASIFYLISAFGRFEWIGALGMVFLFICLAVMVPCCLSDVVYPLLFTREARRAFVHSHEH